MARIKKRKRSDLTTRQKVFVETYLQTLNGAAAARAAKYSEASVYDIAYENLRKPEIRAAIDARLKEVAMSSDEVLARLTEQARANLSPFFRISEDGHIEFDFGAPGAERFHHLIKKVNTKRKRQIIPGKPKQGIPDEEWEHEWVEIEMVDSHAALVDLGKHHRLFGETESRNELVVVDLDAALERAWGRYNKRNRGHARQD